VWAGVGALARVLLLSATSLLFTPSSNMVRQKGQAEARMSGLTSIACSTRTWLTLRPSFSSIHARPPPPPQQKPFFRFRLISTRPVRDVEGSTRRRSCYTALHPPTLHASSSVARCHR